MQRLLALFTLTYFSVFFSSLLHAQESLVPLKVNGELYKEHTARNIQSTACNNLFLRFDTLELGDNVGGFMDDFTTNSILGHHFGSAQTKDTTVFQILKDNIPFGDTTFVNDTTYHIKITITPTDTLVDSVAFPITTITFNKLDTCPILTSLEEVWPAYEIIDTIGKNNPDTTFLDAPTFFQDSLKTFIVWADSATRWLYGSVYINPTMGINPPSIQVATFDGLDNNGIPYDFNETSYGIADSLVSLPINLDKPVSDSIYLSFYYQGGGLGNEPENFDSLTLQFYSPLDTSWNRIWNAKGRKMTAFEQVLIPITDTKYLQKGFQFRFRNYGALSGSLDHWNLDYIKLDIKRKLGDTIHNDIAFSEPLNTLLKDYTSMPWGHFRTDPAGFMKNDTILTHNSNLDTERPTLSLKVMVKRKNALVLDPININPHPQSEPRTHFTIPMYELWTAPNNVVYPTNLDDTCAVFDVEVAANQNGNETPVNKQNDTIRFKQVFQNYYAYDDGSPEAAYHLNTNGGGGLLAYKFSIGTIKDTLAGVFTYFSPAAIDARFEKFWLTIWDATGPNGQPGNIIYQNTNLSQPEYGRIGRFQYNEFDELVGVTGDFYVGWKQLTAKHINVGYDKNLNAKSKIFFNTSGDWYPSSFEGSLMIRPAFKFAKKVEISVPEDKTEDVGIKFYPIPSSGKIQLTGIEKLENPTIAVFDLNGKMVWNTMSKSTEINLSKLENGLYFIRVTDKKLNFSSIHKIIISKGGQRE